MSTPRFLISLVSAMVLLAPAVEAFGADPPQLAVRRPGRSWRANIMRPVDAASRMPFLEFATAPILVETRGYKDELYYVARLRGRYNRPGWRLALSDRPPLNGNEETQTPRVLERQVDVDGNFTFVLLLTDQELPLTFFAVGPGKERQSETDIINAPNVEVVRMNQLYGGAYLGGFSISAGPSFVRYFQSNYGNFTSTALSFSGHYVSPLFFSRFELKAGIQAMVVTLTSNPPNLGPQFIHADSDLTYHLWNGPGAGNKLDFQAGVSFTTLFSNDSPFGFANLISPEFGFRYHYALAPGFGTLVFDFRAQPLGSSILSFGDHGLEFGTTWVLPVTQSKRFELSAMVYDVKYFPDGVNEVHVNWVSFELGYGF